MAFFNIMYNIAAIPLPITRFSGGTGVALVSNFDCTGHELNLLDCRHTQTERISYSCSYSNLVGVQCLGKSLYY